MKVEKAQELLDKLKEIIPEYDYLVVIKLPESVRKFEVSALESMMKDLGYHGFLRTTPLEIEFVITDDS
jgi:hypothetical protein